MTSLVNPVQWKLPDPDFNVFKKTGTDAEVILCHFWGGGFQICFNSQKCIIGFKDLNTWITGRF